MARPRKPTAVKIAEGNRGRRKLNPDAEPQPTPGGTRMPSGMPKPAQTLWRALTAELDRLNLLTVVDVTALEAACRAVAQARAADREIEKVQRKLASGKAAKEAYYHLSILNATSKKAWQQYKAFATEFGLTPASRTRLAAGDTGNSPTTPMSAKRLDPIEQAFCDLPRSVM
jgi:P27 family predicted phage terminase small subunit